MSGHTFVLPPDARESMLDRIRAFALQVYPGKRVKVTVEQYQRRRSDDQNRYLWGVVYPAILQSGGEMLRGWTAEDVHEYLLGEINGWETLEGFGRKRLRPIKRSSRMTTVEFAEYVEQIQQRMAQHGIYVPDPNEHLQVAA